MRAEAHSSLPLLSLTSPPSPSSVIHPKGSYILEILFWSSTVLTIFICPQEHPGASKSSAIKKPKCLMFHWLPLICSWTHFYGWIIWEERWCLFHLLIAECCLVYGTRWATPCLLSHPNSTAAFSEILESRFVGEQEVTVLIYAVNPVQYSLFFTLDLMLLNSLCILYLILLSMLKWCIGIAWYIIASILCLQQWDQFVLSQQFYIIRAWQYNVNHYVHLYCNFITIHHERVSQIT